MPPAGPTEENFMTTTEEMQNMEGRTAVDTDGAKLGKIGQVYPDDQSGQPLWVTIHTGLFGTKGKLRPAPTGPAPTVTTCASRSSKAMVQGRPRASRLTAASRAAENEAPYHVLRGVSRRQRPAPPVTRCRDQGQGQAGDTREDLSGLRGDIQGRDTSGPTTDDAMTRSESGCTSAPSRPKVGRARLRKHVVTEKRHHLPSRSATRKSASSGSRSPTPTAARAHLRRLTSARKSTRSRCTPSVRSRTRRPSRSSASGWARRRSPRRHEVNETLRKEQIDDPDTNGTTLLISDGIRPTRPVAVARHRCGHLHHEEFYEQQSTPSSGPCMTWGSRPGSAGSLMGAVALNGASKDVSNPLERRRSRRRAGPGGRRSPWPRSGSTWWAGSGWCWPTRTGSATRPVSGQTARRDRAHGSRAHHRLQRGARRQAGQRLGTTSTEWHHPR